MFDYDRVIQINQFFTEFTLMSLFSINDIKYYFEKEGLDPESFSIFEIHHTDKKIIKCFNPPTDFNIQMAKKFIHDFETKIKHKFGTVQRSYVLFYEGWYQNDCCGQLRFRLIASKKSNAFILLSPDIYYQNESFPTSLSSIHYTTTWISEILWFYHA